MSRLTVTHRLVNRQVKLYGHLVRADEDDLMTKVTMYQDGNRRKSLFKRVGKPRTKWHTVTGKTQIKELIENE